MTHLSAARLPSASIPSGPILQRKCACGGLSTGTTCPQCAKEKEQRGLLQRNTASDRNVDEVPPIVYDVLRSPGQPLDAETRAFMEPRFGHDFSTIRVHTDATAEQSAILLGAAAYTVGNHIAFASAQFQPGISAGRKLVAHELTHAIQQGGVDSGRDAPLRIASDQSVDESVAEAVSSRIESAELESLSIDNRSGEQRIQRAAGQGFTAHLSGGPRQQEPVRTCSPSDTRYTETKKCGVIDWGHANPENAKSLITKVQRASDWLQHQAKTSQFPATSVHSRHSQESLFRINFFEAQFSVLQPLSDRQVLSVALGIFQYVSIGFEREQAEARLYESVKEFLGMGRSGFAMEDLPSNLISFYRAAFGWSPSRVLKICECIGDLDRAPSGEGRTFIPEGRAWPSELSTVGPEPAGRLWQIES